MVPRKKLQPVFPTVDADGSMVEGKKDVLEDEGQDEKYKKSA